MEGVVQMYRFLCAEGACVCVCALSRVASLEMVDPPLPPAKEKWSNSSRNEGLTMIEKKEKLERGLP